MGLTPEDVRHWDLSVISQLFESAAKLHGSHHELGEALQNGQHRIQDWDGESGDAARAELGKARVDVDASGFEANATARAVRAAEMDISGAKVALDNVDSTAASFGWKVTDNWTIDTSSGTSVALDELTYQTELNQAQSELEEAKSYAEQGDHKLATAVRAAVGDGPPLGGPGSNGQVPAQTGGGDPQKVHSQVPGMDGNPPYENGAHPDRLPLTPGRSFGPVQPLPNDAPWVDRSKSPDEQWQAALAHYKPGDALPDPQYVQNQQLRALGAMARQQGMAYSYGGGHGNTPGPNKGDGSSGKTGLDCSGSIRYAVYEAFGKDPGALSTYQMMNPAANHGAYAAATGPPLPGDVILCGDGSDFHHVAMYVGNGYVIDANSDGTALAVTPLSNEPPSHQTWRPTGH